MNRFSIFIRDLDSLIYNHVLLCSELTLPYMDESITQNDNGDITLTTSTSEGDDIQIHVPAGMYFTHDV